MVVTLNLTNDQVIELIKQMPLAQKKTILLEMANRNRESRMEYGESQIRKLTRKRGKDWDAMSEEEREIFIDDLIHEDRGIA